MAAQTPASGEAIPATSPAAVDSQSHVRKSGDAGPAPSACPRCGAKNRPGVRYCETCGTPLAAAANEGAPSTLICPACRAPYRRGVRFCENCGAALG
jgi:predicted amidophosphoribosyltransferase